MGSRLVYTLERSPIHHKAKSEKQTAKHTYIHTYGNIIQSCCSGGWEGRLLESHQRVNVRKRWDADKSASIVCLYYACLWIVEWSWNTYAGTMRTYAQKIASLWKLYNTKNVTPFFVKREWPKTQFCLSFGCQQLFEEANAPALCSSSLGNI